ncbi:type I DNA topoisomerase [Candidatus Frackibacter sp. WG13]|uniref:type I DNA topoisomerase n=1 Tax=Candidatus Frackibacter sp. WG13 TaxID=2017978 RepID=UPI0008F05892|nr:type I DNA topoisomerase [Candidatus Frackibacter sp. WG13]SFL58917.1 DNA topoisomerase-1 [Candidatus Frackibacter sp. WG13]
MNLIIVESPHKAETIGDMLGEDYVIKASKGHVKDLPKSDLGIDIENNFKPKYRTIRGKGNVLKSLSKLAKKADLILIASDPDREGEAIGWHVKNSLKVSDNKVKRITFNAITKSAVKKALKIPGEIDMDKVNAQQARRLLDRIIGYKISPPMQNLVAKGTSAGRVQSVALKLVKDLDDKIDNFVPVDYWSVIGLFEDDLELKLNKINDKKIKKVTDKKELDRIKATLTPGVNFKVIKSKVTKKKKNPSSPLKTSTMQKLAAKKLGFNSSKTMKIAQKLYEGIRIDGEQQGLITYMRTDSTRVAPEAKEMAQKYIKEKYGQEYVGDYQTKKAGAQDAHEAIRPTNIFLIPKRIKSNLRPNQYKLYKLIWNTFLTSQFAPMRYEQLRLLVTHDKYMFKGLINKQIFDGFEKSLEKVKRKKKMFKSLPDIKKGSQLELNKLKIKKKKTKPPKRFTESSLVDKLEKKGIGRPSTYAAIISKLKSKKYIRVKKKKFYTTQLGRKVVIFLEKHFSNLMDVKFTARMEKALDQIQEGKINWKDYLSEYYSNLKPKIEVLNKKAGSSYSKKRKKYLGVKTDISCKKCNKVMNLKKGKYGFYLGCSNYPDCKNTINIPDKLEISSNYLEKDKIKLKSKLEGFNKSKEERLKEKYGVCPKCGKPFRLINGKNGKFLGCTGYPKCKNTKNYNAS